MSEDLVAWMLEQIAEDERLAKLERDYEGESWHTKHCGWRQREWGEPCECHVPARVLAECQAKRRRIQALVNAARFDMSPVEAQGASREEWAPVSLARALLQLEALPLADRPGYREEWRP